MQSRSGEQLRVTVVGAGIIGASIAYQLARRNVAVTIVEAQQPGSGASSHSFAWINATSKKPSSYHDFNRRSLEMWGRFASQLGTDVGLRWGGQLYWENSPAGARRIEADLEQLQAWGYPARFIDESEIRRLEPNINPWTVSAASLTEIDGQVDPQLVVDACLRRSKELGAVIAANTTVTGFTQERRNGATYVNTTQTSQGDIACDVVVLAAGTAVTPLARMVGLNVPQAESPGVVLRTEPRPSLLHNIPVIYMPSLDEQRPEIHLRQFADGRYMIGEGSQESLARDDSQAHANDLLSRATHYLPGLKGARAIPVPVGYRPMPQDGYPIIGFSQADPNVYIALTHSGVTLAPVISELAALEIIDGAVVETLQPYRPERFS